MADLTDDLPFVFTNTGDHTYDVRLFGVRLGSVYRNPAAWSYGRWFVAGDRVEKSTGGYSLGNVRGARTRAPQKPHGYETRTSAAWRLARTQSAVLIAAMSGRIVEPAH